MRSFDILAPYKLAYCYCYCNLFVNRANTEYDIMAKYVIECFLKNATNSYLYFVYTDAFCHTLSLKQK